MKIIKDQSVRNLTEAHSLLKKEEVSKDDLNKVKNLIKSTVLLLGKL